MDDLSDYPNIRRFLTARTEVSEESLRAVAACLTPTRVGKRHLLVREGVADRTAYFIEEGMTRSYWVVDGQEITTSFSTEGALVFSMDEIYYGRPSEEYVETVEASRLCALSAADLRRLVDSRLDLARWWGIIHQDEYRRLHRSHKERLTLPAGDRYREFARQFPEACCRARLTDIASYLGITLPTLSRIRRKLLQ